MLTLPIITRWRNLLARCGASFGRGEELYERSVRALVEPENDGRFLALDVESGDYELADEALATSRRLRERRPGAVTYLVRVGRSAAFHIGGRRLRSEHRPYR